MTQPTQSRSASLAEAITNVFVGFVMGISVQQAVFPLLGIATTLSQDSAIALLFTAASLVRSYAIRRLFLHIEACRLREEELRRQRLERRFSRVGKPGVRRP